MEIHNFNQGTLGTVPQIYLHTPFPHLWKAMEHLKKQGVGPIFLG